MEIDTPLNLLDPFVAEAFVKKGFKNSPDRLRHVLVVADRVRQLARDLNETYPGMNINEELAYCAALLHDVGYIEEIAESGFHAIDGANFLRKKGFSHLADLTIGHSSAPEEAELRGLKQVSPSEDWIAKLVTYCDVQVNHRGQIVTPEERFQDIIERYGEHSIVGMATQRARERILLIIEAVDRLTHRTAM